MKASFIIILLISALHTTYSQEHKYYYFYTDAQIKENTELNKHQSCQVLSLENSNFCIGTVLEFKALSPSVMSCISFGKFKQINDILYCFDTILNRTYKFRQTDFYSLEAMNHTAVFVKGSRLYLHSCENPAAIYVEDYCYYGVFFDFSDLINSDYWKTGIKNGFHIHSNKNMEKIYYYSNNIPVDSIILIPKDSANFEKRLFFVERYVNANNYSIYRYNDFELKLFYDYYLLTKGKEVYSAGGKIGHNMYWQLKKDLTDYLDLHGKLEFTLKKTENDSLLIIDKFNGFLPDAIPIFNVGDTLKLKP